MHILHYQEWQSPTGYWHCNDVSDLAGISGYWWVPARMLGITPADFVALLVEKYQPDQISFNGKTLLYSWKKEMAIISWTQKDYSYCHKLLLNTNKLLRDKKIMI